MVVECKERSTNVAPIEDSWDVGLEEFATIFEAIEGDGLLKTRTVKDKIPENFDFVHNMRRMKWHGKKCQLLNDVGEMITEERLMACDLWKPIF